MGDLTDADRTKAIADMVKAGATYDEASNVIDNYLQEQAAAQSKSSATTKALTGAPVGAGTLGKEMTDKIISLTAPMLGGVIGSGTGARIAASPRVARAVEGLPGVIRSAARFGVEAAQPLLEGTGIMGGDIAGRAATGQPQDLPSSASMGLAGAGIGEAFRTTNRILGGMGGIPAVAVRDAGVPRVGVVPAVDKVIRPLPRTVGQADAGISSEALLMPRAAKAVQKLVNMTTEPRQQKLQILGKMEAAGVRIDPDPVLDILKKRIPTIRMEPNTAGPFTAYLNDFMDKINQEALARGGTFSPLEWDEFIRTNLAPKAYTNAGNEVSSRFGPIIREAKTAAAKALRDAMPPQDRMLDAKISDLLDKVDEAEAFFGGDATGVVNRIRNIRLPGNEEKAAAIQFLGKHADSGLAKKIFTLSTRRSFTTDIREPFAGKGRQQGAFLLAPAETAAQVMAPAQPFVGPLASPFVGPHVAPFLSQGGNAILDAINSALEARKRQTPLQPEQ